jgi:hypothetical protein
LTGRWALDILALQPSTEFRDPSRPVLGEIEVFGPVEVLG